MADFRYLLHFIIARFQVYCLGKLQGHSLVGFGDRQNLIDARLQTPQNVHHAGGCWSLKDNLEFSSLGTQNSRLSFFPQSTLELDANLPTMLLWHLGYVSVQLPVSLMLLAIKRR